MKRILLAEDDDDFAGILKQYLEISGFSVCWCKNGSSALKAFSENTFDICVLDVMMPEIDGFTLAQKIVAIDPKIPFIFLTARQLKEDVIRGLQLGADDYITKPFEAEELILRLHNVLRRNVTETDKAMGKQIAIGKYIFDSQRFELKLENRLQQLTEKEAALIAFLFEHKNEILKRETILKSVWGNDDYFSGRSMDVFISRLRKYFNDDPNISIESIRNIGLEFKVGEI